MKVALYARVSKADDSQDPENQLARLRAHAKAHGWKIHDEYTDHGSGADANRPRLDDLMRDARGHRFGIVLCTKIDRFGRSVLNLERLIAELDRCGCQFECVDQAFSTGGPEGKLLRQVLSAVAEFELELIRSRTRDGLRAAVAHGVRLGRRPDRKRTNAIIALKAQGLIIRDIAEKLSMTHGAVKEQLRRARKRGLI